MSSLTKPTAGVAGTPIDPGSPGGILIDPETELSGSPSVNEVIKGDGLGGWIIGPAPHGPTWKELLLVPEQLLNGASGGILQAILAKMDTNPTATDTFEITDGTTTETFTFQGGVSAGFGVQILGSATLTQAELVARINAVSTLWSAVECAALDKYFSPTAGDPQFVVYRTATSAAADRVFGTLTAPAGIQVVAFTAASDYQETGGLQTDLPAVDPTTKTFGFQRDFAGLQQNHLHSIACDQSQYVWDADDEVWRNTGSSTPLATETAAGIAELATTAETNTGTDDLRIVTPLKLDTKVTADIGTHAAVADAHHARYVDGEAVSAMGAVADGNALNHARPVQATEGALGIAEIATQAETDAGTDDQRIVTPLKLAISTQSKRHIMAFSTNGGVPNGGTRYLAHEGVAVTSAPVLLPAAAVLIGITITVDGAPGAAREYEVRVIADPGGADTLIGSALTLIDPAVSARRRDLSAAIGDGVLWGVVLVRSSGAGSSSFSDVRVELELRMP